MIIENKIKTQDGEKLDVMYESNISEEEFNALVDPNFNVDKAVDEVMVLLLKISANN